MLNSVVASVGRRKEILFICFVIFSTEKYGITPERPHSSVPVEDIIIEAARQLPLYFSRFFVVKVGIIC